MTAVRRRLRVDRKPGELSGDPKRVITRLFKPGDPERLRATTRAILELPEAEVCDWVDEIREKYSHRHRDFEGTLDQRFERELAAFVRDADALSRERRLLLSAFFTMEYSIESAALLNPSIVAHPNQRDVPERGLRFIMSFRAIGEGHISSIAFRSGVVHADGSLSFDASSRHIETPEVQTDALYDRHLFELKLNEMGKGNEVTSSILGHLNDWFSLGELLAAMRETRAGELFPSELTTEPFETMEWLARSNYQVKFRPDRRISERIIFPVSKSESNGIEDARFVRFVDDNGAVIYYATYTAYNGNQILPQLMETSDFFHFKAITLNGRAVQNKGMALFPRLIDGRYFMISRQDGVNLHIMSSEHLHFWQESQILCRPERPWEFIQIGNCGSPLETAAGWLVLTHGVGPMRRYCLGVMLLDLKDPSKVIARLREPILEPNEHERDGYVPNVLYTCGAIIHEDQLIVPYAMSDTRCAIASTSVSGLLEELTRNVS